MSKIGYAIVECGGRQLKVREGDTVMLDGGTVGEKVELENVLAVRSASGMKTGDPYVKGARVVCVVQEEARGPKIAVVKFKKRKGYRRKQGHRQSFMSAQVEAIRAGRATKKTEDKETDNGT